MVSDDRRHAACPADSMKRPATLEDVTGHGVQDMSKSILNPRAGDDKAQQKR
jgi:hypothetical protein